MADTLRLKDRLIIKRKATREFSTGQVIGICLALVLILTGLLEPRPALPDGSGAAGTGDAPGLCFNIFGTLKMNDKVRRYVSAKGFAPLFTGLKDLSLADANLLMPAHTGAPGSKADKVFTPEDYFSLNSLKFNALPPLPDPVLRAQTLSAAGSGGGPSAADLLPGPVAAEFSDDGITAVFLSVSYRDRESSVFRKGLDVLSEADRRLHERIARADKAGKFVTVTLDWGALSGEKYKHEQQKLARLYADAGADLIIGCEEGPARSFETYKSSLIIYNLGSLLQSDEHGGRSRAVALTLTLTPDRRASLHFMPYTQRLGLPVPQSPLTAAASRRRLLRGLTGMTPTVHPDESFTLTYPEPVCAAKLRAVEPGFSVSIR